MNSTKHVAVLSSLLLILGMGVVRADEWPGGQPVPNSFGAVLTDNGMNTISQEFSQYLTLEMVRDMMFASNPVVDIDEWWGSAYAEITGVYFSYPASVFTDVTSGGVYLDARLSNIDIDLHLDGDVIGIGYSLSGDMIATRIRAEGLLTAWLQNGQVRVGLDITNIGLVNPQIRINGWPSWLQWVIDLIFDLIQGTLIDTVSSMLESELPPVLEELLNSLPFSYQFELMGYLIDLVTEPSDIIFRQASMGIWLGADVSVTPSDPCVPPEAGSYYTPSNRINYQPTTPVGGVPYEVAIVLGDDAINRILYAVQNSGLLCLTIDEQFLADMGFPYGFTSELFGMLVPRLHDYAVNAPMLLDLRMQHAPIVHVNPVGSEYMLTLTAEEIYMDFYIYAMDRWMRLLTFDGTINNASLSLDVTLENSIHIEISDEIDVTTEVIFDELLQLTDAERTLVESYIPGLLQFIVPLLTAVLEDIPIPTFEGYGVQVVEVSQHGTAHDWIGLFGNLIITDPGQEFLLDCRQPGNLSQPLHAPNTLHALK